MHNFKMAAKLKRKLWRDESMVEAVRSMEEDGKGLREAARNLNVPGETLWRRVAGITTLNQAVIQC